MLFYKMSNGYMPPQRYSSSLLCNTFSSLPETIVKIALSYPGRWYPPWRPRGHLAVTLKDIGIELADKQKYQVKEYMRNGYGT